MYRLSPADRAGARNRPAQDALLEIAVQATDSRAKEVVALVVVTCGIGWRFFDSGISFRGARQSELPLRAEQIFAAAKCPTNEGCGARHVPSAQPDSPAGWYKIPALPPNHSVAPAGHKPSSERSCAFVDEMRSRLRSFRYIVAPLSIFLLLLRRVPVRSDHFYRV